jgi:SAM-dependent methyltransferase
MAAAVCVAAPFAGDEVLGSVIASSATYHPERVAETAIELLAVGPGDAVLELGCGSGRLLARLAARTRRGFAAGIDPSELMVRHARHRNRRFIEAGRVRVELGSSGDLSIFADGSFDRVLGVHVPCFWSDPVADLTEARRVLCRGGGLLLGFRPAPERGAAEDPSRVPVRRVEEWLRAAGFASVEHRVLEQNGRPLAWVRGRR